MLTKEQIESMHTLLVRERPMGTSVAAVDELCRLALLGLERDLRAERMRERADQLADALKWERVAFDERKRRLETAERDARMRQLSGAHTAESWNAQHPIGTRVRYYPIYPPINECPPRETATRSKAWTLGDGSVVVCVEGTSGGVHLTHVEVRP